MLSHTRTLFLSALFLAASACPGAEARAARTDPLGGTGGGPINGSLHVRVIHDGTTDPFEGAFVMVGLLPGSPFSANWGFTTATGEITFTDPALQGATTVTAGAPGCRYFTLVSVNANDLVIPLKPTIYSDPTYEVGDYVSGIDVNNGSFHVGDGYVDMAFVVPSLKLEDLVAFQMGDLLGPPEIIDILGQPVEVPSNIFIPQQWELFIEIIKDHYYLYLPTGDYTLAALSFRTPRDAIISGGDIQDLLPVSQWREIDIMNVNVSGNTYTADLYVDPDLQETVTLNLANIPDGSTAYCISVGDLDNRAGLGRLIPLGLNSLDCPAGSGPCAGPVRLTTTPATGEFTGMTYFPVVAANLTDTDDMLVLIDREAHPQTYTADMVSFFSTLDLTYSEGVFSWNDVMNPHNGSPDVHVQTARIKSTESDEVYWEFIIPGEVLSFMPPSLPPDAPPCPVEGSTYTWQQLAFGLGYNLPSFNFNDFAFSDIIEHGTHVALDDMDIAVIYPADIPDYLDSAPVALKGICPNPFSTKTTIGFNMPNSSEMELSVLTVDGRAITSLASGRVEAGYHQFEWLGRDASGHPLPSGIYVVRLKVGDSITSRRTVLMR